MKILEETKDKVVREENHQMKSMSVGNIHETKSDPITNQTKSLVPVLSSRISKISNGKIEDGSHQFSVVSKSLDLR